MKKSIFLAIASCLLSVSVLADCEIYKRVSGEVLESNEVTDLSNDYSNTYSVVLQNEEVKLWVGHRANTIQTVFLINKVSGNEVSITDVKSSSVEILLKEGDEGYFAKCSL